MKIQYIDGDMFKSDINYLAHGCNAQGVMGSGVAAIVRRDFTQAYDEYVARHKIKPWELGEVQFVPSNGKVIINAITQKFFGRDGYRYVSYDAVAEAMYEINARLKDHENPRLGMPKIGAGLGGGDWNVIASIIESELKDVQPTVFIL